MRQTTRLGSVLLLLCSGMPLFAAEPEQVIEGLRRFYAKTARPDGSFQPGVELAYPGMSDSAYSDLAPTVYAVVIHKTLGWTLPDEEKTKVYLQTRQGEDGAFVNVKGTADPRSAQARAYNTTMGLVACRAL